MKRYEAMYMPGGIIEKGFETEQKAWDWVRTNYLCDSCRELWDNDESDMCSAEWEVELEGWDEE